MLLGLGSGALPIPGVSILSVREEGHKASKQILLYTVSVYPFLSIQLSLALSRIASWLSLTFPSRLLPQPSVYSSLASWGCLPKVEVSLAPVCFVAPRNSGRTVLPWWRWGSSSPWSAKEVRHALIAAHAFFITLPSCLEILFILLQSPPDLSVSCRKCTVMGSKHPRLLTRHLPSLLHSPPHKGLWATCGYRAGQGDARCPLASDMQREPFQSLWARFCPSVFHRGERQAEEPIPSTGPSLRGVRHLSKGVLHNRVFNFYFYCFP